MVDGYVKALLSDPDPDPDPDLPAMRTHLAGCAACAEEALSLILLAAEQDCLDAATALLRIQDDPAFHHGSTVASDATAGALQMDAAARWSRVEKGRHACPA